MSLKISTNNFKLLLFSFFTCLITYGFTLSNFSLSVDSESPIYPDYSMALGRWGTNLVRYQIFEGLTPYFTLLLGLVFLSLTAVEMVKLFNFKKSLGYLFCALFLSFPQLAYQLVFTMQADAVPLGFLCSVVAINLFQKSSKNIFSAKSIGFFIASSLLLMFVIAIYQALIIIPVIVYLICFFQNTYQEEFNLKSEISKGFQFAVLVLLSFLLYYISVKLICPPVDGGYLSSYTSGNSDNRFSNFYTLWIDNLNGVFYYGELSFKICYGLSVLLIIRFLIEKKRFIYRFLTLFFLLLLPFFISFFITNGYNPPRIYIASGIVFAFIIIHSIRNIKEEKIVVGLIGVICLTNVYFITQLFYSNYKIYNHDKEIAKKIDFLIHSKYPEFDENINYVYFYGGLPYEHHEKLRLPNSEVFGGSIFSWENGDNWRIINLFRFNDVAYYKMIDNKDTYLKIKDSISSMPIWPKQESVKLINGVAVIKLSNEKGRALPVE